MHFFQLRCTAQFLVFCLNQAGGTSMTLQWLESYLTGIQVEFSVLFMIRRYMFLPTLMYSSLWNGAFVWN